MSSFVFSDLQMIGQFGTTVGIGLLFDTLIVRSLMTPSIAALLGRWFWWPRRVGSPRRARRPDILSPPLTQASTESVHP
jgi:putative drug exporter of the RND superfamily